MAIPNRFDGRLAFLFCGGVMFAAGFLIFKRGQYKAKMAAAEERHKAVEPK
jgi:hypothetical protein